MRPVAVTPRSLEPQDAGDQAHHGADGEQHDQALGHLLLDEGDDAAGQEEADDDEDGGEAGHSAPFVEGRIPAARGSRSQA